MGRIYEYDIFTESSESIHREHIKLPDDWEYVTRIGLLKYSDDPSASAVTEVTVTQNSQSKIKKVSETFLRIDRDFNNQKSYLLPVFFKSKNNIITIDFDGNGTQFNENEKWRLFILCENKKSQDFFYQSKHVTLTSSDNGRKKVPIKLDINKRLIGVALRSPLSIFKFDVTVYKNSQIYIKNIYGGMLSFSNKLPFKKRIFLRELKTSEFDIELNYNNMEGGGNTGGYTFLYIQKLKTNVDSNKKRLK